MIEEFLFLDSWKISAGSPLYLESLSLVIQQQLIINHFSFKDSFL